MADVRLVGHAFDPGAELSHFAARVGDAGGIVSFTGQVRSDGGVAALELSHYEPLTLPGMAAVAAEAEARWPLAGLTAIHRTGRVAPGEAIVFVAAAAKHRRDAFEAADYVMDHLKSTAFFWKREQRGGTWHWIEPRDQDRHDLSRWQT